VPPGDVSRLTAKAGNGVVLLSWRVPTDADFDHVVVTRSSPVGRDSVVYTGKGTTYQDRPLLNGVRYRYVIVSYDVTGNASGGVGLSALPRTLALLAPRAGATVRAGSRPLLLWRKVRHATYYNVQLYRGAEKVFTAWPSSARLRVSREWRYAGRRQTLSAGVYRWYVWPGFGARSQRRYGTMLGQSGFTVVAQSGPVAKPGG
jgi:hypothetical protein